MASKENKTFKRVEIQFDYFEWDNLKRDQNLNKHLIDFDDAIRIFERPVLRVRSDRATETRHLAVGVVEGIEIAVIYTERNGACRVISARRARKNERKTYHKAFPSGP